ncbi:MAG: DUF2924 domain-containing protein [Hyphomonadaceae bacterium]|nr:DUF2924 domain-containing protein [Hyphomonadaceae bacterium]
MPRINSKLQSKLDRLETLDHAELSLKWTRFHGSRPPKAASRKFLVRALAYEFQAQSMPGNSKSDQKVLAASLDAGDDDLDVNTGKHTTQSHRPALKLDPGSQLIREWNGKTHMVAVIEEGFVYKNKVWKSLSAIAKDITGAHWSGPRFFGLNKVPL